MTRSYAQHMATLKHPDYPDDRVVSVKVYWVEHLIATQKSIAEGLDPGHPSMFLPFYQGQFDPNGNLMDQQEYNTDGTLKSGDPLLYWLVPIIKLKPLDSKRSPVVWYVCQHAGDLNWYWPEGSKQFSPGPPELGPTLRP